MRKIIAGFLAVAGLLAVQGLVFFPAKPQARDFLYCLWKEYKYNDGGSVIQRVPAIAYDPVNSWLFFGVEPALFNQPNLLKIKLAPKKDLLQKAAPHIELIRITTNVIKAMAISPDGVYSAFGGKARELVILKNDLRHGEIEFDHEITRLVIGDNILAMGDAGGRLTLIELADARVLATIPLFDGPVSAIQFVGPGRLMAIGQSSRIVEVDAGTGKILRAIETRAWKEKFLHWTALRPCAVPAINRLIHIPNKGWLITAHGNDSCHENRIAVWDAATGSHIRDITLPHGPVHEMVWIPPLQIVAMADSKRNLLTLSLDDFSVRSRFLPESLEMPNKSVGHVLDMASIPNSPYILLGTGSLFSGGAGAMLTKMDKDSFHIIAFLKINVSGYMDWFLNKDLFQREGFKNPF